MVIKDIKEYIVEQNILLLKPSLQKKKHIYRTTKIGNSKVVKWLI